jgi:hypothetical protein
MKHNKTGTIFIVFVLALAGIGISYAGFTDVINVYGSVDTATVDIVKTDYSGTDVWKVYAVVPGAIPPTGEIVIWHGFVSDTTRPTEESLELQYRGCEADLISSSWAKSGTTHGDKLYDVDMVWDNIFPCIDFSADVIIHYAGTIPAHVDVTELVWDDTGDNFDFSDYTTFHAYWYILGSNGWEKGSEVTFPVQMHYCQYIGIEVTIHIAQDNLLQDKHGEFSFDITALQWNDECNPTIPDKTLELPGSDVQVDLALIRNPGTIGYGPNPTTPNTYFDIRLANVPDGYDVDDGDYPGFCADSTVYIYWQWYKAYLWDSRDPNLPSYAQDDEQWDYVNYILNHWDDSASTANWQEIQAAVWYFTDANPNYEGFKTAKSDAIIADALANGALFKPGPGEWLAVICDMGPTTQLSFIIVDP